MAACALIPAAADCADVADVADRADVADCADVAADGADAADCAKAETLPASDSNRKAHCLFILNNFLLFSRKPLIN
jgi:hypothetical protein